MYENDLNNADGQSIVISIRATLMRTLIRAPLGTVRFKQAQLAWIEALEQLEPNSHIQVVDLKDHLPGAKVLQQFGFIKPWRDTRSRFLVPKANAFASVVVETCGVESADTSTS
jgi:alpha-D-ribose 1-methylphosphonate 5-triphosphate diphosphatase PhnM